MIHQVLGGAEGPASDVEIGVRYMLRLKQRLNTIIAKHTGRSIEQVEKTATAITSCRRKKPKPMAWWMKSCNLARKSCWTQKDADKKEGPFPAL